MPLAEAAERAIGHARHGSDDQVVLELDVADLHDFLAALAFESARRVLILYATRIRGEGKISREDFPQRAAARKVKRRRRRAPRGRISR
jgi:hypothetical protein